MKKSVKIIVSLCVAALAFFTFTGLAIYSQNLTKENENSSIIAALNEIPSHLKCNGAKSKATMAEEAVKSEMEALLYDAVDFDNYFIVECDGFMSFISDADGSVLWRVSGHIAGVPDYRSCVYFVAVYDEQSGKMVRFECDYATKKNGDVYLYEELSDENRIPDLYMKNAAYRKVEYYTKLYAEYLGVEIKNISFLYSEHDRYTFNAVLSDSKGEKAEVKVSYNLINGRYNFNY